MKVVILAGGLGTRLMEETEARPKPMVEIGGKPVLWHIMKIYAHYGYNEFIICLGYKSWFIKQYFLNYFLYHSDLTVDLQNNCIDVHTAKTESFKVTLVETGLNTKTAGRLKRIQPYVGTDDFMLTYGDGVADINIARLVEFHHSHKKLATITAIQPEGRFGGMQLQDTAVKLFREKDKRDAAWVNGGFFVLRPGFFDYLPNDADMVMLEDEPLENLACNSELIAYRHHGFWKCMDALRDKVELEQLWDSGNAAWKVW